MITTRDNSYGYINYHIMRLSDTKFNENQIKQEWALRLIWPFNWICPLSTSGLHLNKEDTRNEESKWIIHILIN